MPHHRAILAILLVGLLFDFSWNVSLARAYSEAVAHAIAREAVARHRPGHDPLLGDPVADAIAASLAGDVANPEIRAASHVHFVDVVAGSTSPTAVTAVVDAYESIVSGLVSGDRMQVSFAIAMLSIATSDLADPFRTIGSDRAGPAGVRYRFSDGTHGADLEWLIPVSGRPPMAGVAEVRAAALELATFSASCRDTVERLATGGRHSELARLRRGLIEQALGLTCDVMLAAGTAAEHSPHRLGLGRPPAITVFPNPATTQSSLRFRSPTAGTAEVRVFGVDGRLVMSFDEPVTPGAQAISFGSRLPRGLMPGTYLATVSAPGVHGVARFTRIAH